MNTNNTSFENCYKTLNDRCNDSSNQQVEGLKEKDIEIKQQDVTLKKVEAEQYDIDMVTMKVLDTLLAKTVEMDEECLKEVASKVENLQAL